MGSENLEAQSFEIRANGCHLVKIHLKSGQICPNFKWFGFQMFRIIAIANHLKTGPFEIQSSKSSDFKLLHFSLSETSYTETLYM